MVKERYKDILIIILTLALLLLGSYVINIQNDNHNTESTKFKDNSNLRYIEENNLSNYESIFYNESPFSNFTTVENEENKYNSTNNDNISNTLNNSNILNNCNSILNNHNSDNNIIYNNISNNDILNSHNNIRSISLNELFMNLRYSNIIPLSNEQGKGIIKKYNGESTIDFDIRTYKPNLDNPEYVIVYKEILYFKHGTYYKYTYIPKYTNNTKSYCYYKKIGNYHIIMGFKRENKYTKDMWIKWNEHINNILFE